MCVNQAGREAEWRALRSKLKLSLHCTAETINEFDPLTGKKTETLSNIKIYANSHYVTPRPTLQNAIKQIRKDLEALLSHSNTNCEYFRGKFTDFLSEASELSDEEFFKSYSKLPALSKQDYAEAGQSVMSDRWAAVDAAKNTFSVEGKPLESLRRLRNDDYLMPMATGGSTSTPLSIMMTKQHMFSMLFTFFKCWYRMGWRPGERMLVF